MGHGGDGKVPFEEGALGGIMRSGAACWVVAGGVLLWHRYSAAAFTHLSEAASLWRGLPENVFLPPAALGYLSQPKTELRVVLHTVSPYPGVCF